MRARRAFDGAAFLWGVLLVAPAASRAHDPPASVSPAEAEAEEGLTVPVPVEKAELRYPAEALAEGRAVEVELVVSIDEQGRVGDVEVTRSGGPAFDQAAIRTMRRWRFAPATRQGEPTSVRVVVPVHFHPPEGVLRSAPARPPAPAPEREETEPAPLATYQSVVEARDLPATASATLLPRQALDDVNARSAGDLLRRVPGVQIVQHGAEGKAPQIYLRGFDASHGSDVEVRVAGVPLNEPGNVHGHGYLDLAFLLPELVEALEVAPGSFRLRQGPFATAGTVRYQLAAPRPGLTVITEGGAPLRARAAVIGALGGDRYLGVEAVRSAGFGQGRAGSRVSANAGWAEELGALRVDGGAFVAAARYELPGAVRLDDVDAGRIDPHDSYRVTDGSSARALTHLGGALRLGALELDARVFGGLKRLALVEDYTGFLDDERQGDGLAQQQRHLDGGAQVGARWRVVPVLRVDLFGELRSILAERGLGPAGPEGRPSAAPGRDWWGSLGAAGGGGLTLLPADWLRASLSLRFDTFIIDEGKESPWGVAGLSGERRRAYGAALSPRASVSVRPGLDGTRVFAAVGRGVRPPANASGQPAAATGGLAEAWLLRLGAFSTAENAELGVAWETRWLRLSGAIFGVLSSGEVLFDHVARTTTLSAASRRLGAEARVALSPVRWLEVSADLSALDARFVAAELRPTGTGRVGAWPQDLIGGEPIPGVPPLLATLRGALEPVPGLRLGGHALLLGPRPLRYRAVARPVAVVNMFARVRWRWMVLHGEIDNLLDVEYGEGAAMFASRWDRGRPASRLPVQHLYAGPPRMVRVGVSFEL